MPSNDPAIDLSPCDGDPLPADFPSRRRVLMTASCRDCDPIPKVAEAGQVFEASGKRVQRMHNDVLVEADGYCGIWMTEIIRRLHGHHEPQEERLFHEVVSRLPAGATMFELGGYWAYYSLWLKRVVPDARTIIAEPDPVNLGVGRRNFALNGQSAVFLEEAVGTAPGSMQFRCEDGSTREVAVTSVDALMERHAVGFLDLLHADIQGAELAMLEGAAETIRRGRVRLVMVSTHHHNISGDPLTHQRCLRHLKNAGAHILCEHTIAESFSGDGLILASFDPRDADLAAVKISYNRASESLFRETEYDLAEARLARDRTRGWRLRLGWPRRAA
jgi:FkbM family methyltransferase